ncbi:MAG TPA: RIP metalloprotease RseP, partial [Gemmatimonadaceae bacterium]
PAGVAPDSLMDAIAPYLTPVIDAVVPGMPAARAGLRAGDSVVAVDGNTVRTWNEMTHRIEGSPGRPLAFIVIRDGVPVRLTIRPDSVPADATGAGSGRIIGRIGAKQRSGSERVPISLGTGLHVAWQETWVVTGSVVTALHRLATGSLSVRNLSGPVGIGRASYSAAQAGWGSLLSLIAILSINLAVFNLLPLPILDGGQILLTVAESVKGSALSPRTREYLMRFGLAAIALLFVIVMYNDITSLVKNLFGL